MPGFLDKVLGRGDDNNQNDTNNDQNNNADQNNNNADNNADNVDNNTPFWDNKSVDDKNADDSSKQTIEVVQKPAEKTPDEQMQEHITGLNLTNGIDSNQIMEDMREGKTESFAAAMQTVSANSYQAAMTSMNDIMDAKIAEVTETATANANASVNSNMAVLQMQREMVFTKDKDIEPIAKAVLAQALKTTDSTEEAIVAVKGFFEKMGGEITPPSNDSGNPQFPGHDQNNSGKKSHDDWLGVLTGKK